MKIENEVRKFVHKYLDVSREQEKTIVDYALATWLPLPPILKYLHIIGENGTGKTRVGVVMESICFNPITAQGKATPRTVIRLMDKNNPCTLIMDEADLLCQPEEDENGESVRSTFETLLGVGAMKATARIGWMEQEQPNTYQPKFYNVHGYKVIMSRKPFSDMAIASRCIVVRLKPKKLRLEIPQVLDDEFWQDSEKIKTMLQEHFSKVVIVEGQAQAMALNEQGIPAVSVG